MAVCPPQHAQLHRPVLLLPAGSVLPVFITENYAVLLQSCINLSVDDLPFWENFAYIIEQNIPNKCRMVIKPTTAPITIPVTLIASIAATDSPPSPAVAERESYNQCTI